jgi:hypothetical protein
MSALSQNPSAALCKGEHSLANLVLLFLLAAFTFVLMGYHPGLEDDSFYLAAIKWRLHPALFPHDADFFRVQFQATIFDKLIASSIRLTHLPVAWGVLLWQMAAIFFLLYSGWRIARRCFATPEAQWAATALVGVLLSMPIGGIAINMADQYLHPRGIAAALILAAVVAVIDRYLWLAGILLAVAFSIHAIMASFGISFGLFLLWQLRSQQRHNIPAATALLIPLGWLFEPGSESWRQAAATRGFYDLGRWHWYEWLGVFAPLVILFVMVRFFRPPAVSDHSTVLVPFVTALLYYGVFQTVVGLVIMLPPSLERLRPFEPMRYLHLLYILFFLIGGGLLGEYLLRRHVYRWLLLFVPLSAGMLYAQLRMYSDSPHLELPFVEQQSQWVQAFEWIRQNTSPEALFAIDPHYEALDGEDQHGFRALAERSVLADYEKDGGMAARVPTIAPRWLKEVTALNGWRNFGPADFRRLKNEFGVTWVVLSNEDTEFQTAPADAMTCQYENQGVKVCRLY